MMILVSDGLLLQFCQKSLDYITNNGDGAITKHEHALPLSSMICLCDHEFSPMHGFWPFPFERYNGILEGQPTKNRSIEMHLMWRFQKDNLNLQLHQEATEWPEADIFLEALPSPS